MSDEFSFSEIDSVSDDFTEVNEAEDESTESKNEQSHAKVILELPPGVIKVSHELQTSSQKSPGSSIASSCLRGMNGLKLKGAPDNHDIECESSTSYVVLGQPGAGHGKNDEADDDSFASSAWSQVRGPKKTGYKSSSTCSSERGGAVTSSGFRVLYSSDDSTTYSCENQQASSNESLGSLASTFDVISIYGGIIRRCKKCTFHNHQSSTICKTCETALVGNPCIELDEEIARNLRAKEEKDSFACLQARERKREKLPDKPPFEKATFFAEEVEELARGFSFIQQLPQGDLSGQAMFFITRAIQRGHSTEIALFYCFTLSNDDTVDAVRKRGFQTNTRVGFENTTTINEDVDDAWSHFSKHALFAISETEDECMVETTSKARGWLVAIIEDFTTNSAHLASSRSVPSEHVLPLVSFDARERHRQDLQHLKAGMKQICVDFFEITLGIDPRPKKRKTAIDFDDCLDVLDKPGADVWPTTRPSWYTRPQQQSSEAIETMSDSVDDSTIPLPLKPSCEELPSQDDLFQMAPNPDYQYSCIWDWSKGWESPKHEQQPQNPVVSLLNDQRWASGTKEDDIHDNLTPPAKKIAGIPELPLPPLGCRDASLHPDEDNGKSWCSEPAPQGYGRRGRAGLKEDPDNDDQDDCHGCHSDSAAMGCRDVIDGSKSCSFFEILQTMQPEQLHKILQKLGVAYFDFLLWSRPLCIATIERFCEERGMTEEDLVFFAEF